MAGRYSYFEMEELDILKIIELRTTLRDKIKSVNLRNGEAGFEIIWHHGQIPAPTEAAELGGMRHMVDYEITARGVKEHIGQKWASPETSPHL